MARRWWLALFLVLLLPAPSLAQALRPTAHITSQTTTTLVSAVAAKQVQLNAGSLCVDAGGAATGITLQSTAGTNLFGTGVVWVVPAGACLNFFARPQGGFYGNPTAVGTGLAVVTTVGNGPVEVYLEVTQR